MRRTTTRAARVLTAALATAVACAALGAPAAAAPDPCSNALARQQTRAASLADCRAYELVSAPDAGGYDLSSRLAPGQVPLPSYPAADDRALYSLHFGAIPGVAGTPPNLGGEPYLATRTAQGWRTSYVGLDADGMADPGSFASPVLGADASLRTFAFGGAGICDPCFTDGSTNVPLRLPGGELVKGMAGSLGPAADPAGEVRAPFSADGSHFIFGSEEKFESAGNEGSVSIYSRDLETDSTEVVSTMPDGTTMSGEPAELAVSADGTRTLIGRLVSTDSAGNRRFDLYMHRAGVPGSVEVLDSPSGAIFAGMNAEGTFVYFTTADQLAGDTDTSADLFGAIVAGSATVVRISTGSEGTGNTDACAPSGEWNVVSGGPNCSVLAFAGGAGVSEQGVAYFFSPEQLDGSANGVAGEANLYRAAPSLAPSWIATLEPADAAVVHARDDSEAHDYADFQVSPTGRWAAFTSTLSLSGFDSAGHREVYRHDVLGDLDCVSCPASEPASADAALSSDGLGLTDDGRVFFDTAEALAGRDTNSKRDAYQWSEGDGAGLVSSGLSPFDSALLGVGADGRDAFFFTREKLDPVDRNGATVKLYDARTEGGFFVIPSGPQCAASDECHGPGTKAAAPPPLGTLAAKPTRWEATARRRCRKGKVRRRSRCAKRHRQSKRRGKKRTVNAKQGGGK